MKFSMRALAIIACVPLMSQAADNISQTRYYDWLNANARALTTLLGNKVTVQPENYTATGNDNANSKAKIVFPSQATFFLNSQITGEKLTSNLQSNSSSLPLSGLSRQQGEMFAYALSLLHIETQFLPENQLKQTWKIAPFKLPSSNQSGNIDYQGLTLITKYSQTDLGKSFFNAEGNFTSGALHTAMQNAQNSWHASLQLSPLSGSFTIQETGSIHFNASPISLDYISPQSSLKLEAKSILAEGQSLQHDPTSQMILGSLDLFAKNGTFTSSFLSQPITFDELHLKQAAEKTDNRYQSTISLSAKPTSNIAELFGIQGVNIKNIDATLSAKQLSATAITAFTQIKASPQLPHSDDWQKLLTQIARDGSELNLRLIMTTAQGTATSNSTLRLNKNANIQTWVQAINSRKQNNLLNVMISQSTFTSTTTLPTAIIKNTGLTGVFELLGRNFLQVKGSDYVIEAHNQNNQLLVNNKVLISAAKAKE